MDVILLEKVENLGDLGDKVSVRPGYARNYLIPQRKAKFATEKNIAEFERRRAELEMAAAKGLVEAEGRREGLVGLVITIAAKAGTEGKLFGSIGTADIAEAVSVAAGISVEKREVRLPAGALRQVGEYEVEIHLHTDVNTPVMVQVIAQE